MSGNSESEQAVSGGNFLGMSYVRFLSADFVSFSLRDLWLARGTLGSFVSDCVWPVPESRGGNAQSVMSLDFIFKQTEQFESELQHSPAHTGK